MRGVIGFRSEFRVLFLFLLTDTSDYGQVVLTVCLQISDILPYQEYIPGPVDIQGEFSEETNACRYKDATWLYSLRITAVRA